MKETVFDFGTTAYLGGSSSLVSFEKDTGFLDDPKDSFATVDAVNKKKLKEVEFLYWGQQNNLPVSILNKAHANITVASNIDFNARISYGDGLIVVKKVKKEGQITYEELIPSEYPEIFSFIEDNNILRILQEAGNDLVVFGDAYIELILNRDQKSKIVMVRHKETAFSRLSKQNEKTGKIDFHGYSSKWGESQLDDVIVTPFLDRNAPIFDLKKRLGLLPNEDGKHTKSSEKRFVLSLGLPVPGRFYYNKPYWWSIFKSGWYDISCAMPVFKQSLIENKMKILYEININENFWDRLYKSEGITDTNKKSERKMQFLKELDNFLAGKENAGKSFVKHFKYDLTKGYELHDIIIKPIPATNDGGEYNEDVEEANNVISYAMGVHPSLQGATPGKSKTINGTEARELFIIKQAMTKPIRDALLSFLYVCKAVNGWDTDVHFVIPNIMLTTLDKNTGAEKNIGNQKI